MSAVSVATLNQRVDAANAEVFDRIVAADPVLVDIAPAGDVIPGMQDKMILHAGPPVDWEHMSGAQKGSCIALALFEGWAASADEAIELLSSGRISFEPNHHHDAVGPMAGTTSRSLPVYVVENATYGNRAYCRPAEWLQQFGAYSEASVAILRNWRDLQAPPLARGIRQAGGIKLKPLIAKALQMGDEIHNRPLAGSSLLAKALPPAMLQAGLSTEELKEGFTYLALNDFLFLPVSMASAKSAADPARNVDYSTVVTAMCRNGTEFGIRVSGLGDEWFTAPAGRPKGRMMPGFSEADIGGDMGDSTITETVGWGAFCLAGAPGILAQTGGTFEEALAYSRQMYDITVGVSPDYQIPALDFKGAPVGIDIRKVVETGIVPVLDSAMAHREPGYGNLGTGLVRPSIECFKAALAAFTKRYGTA